MFTIGYVLILLTPGLGGWSATQLREVAYVSQDRCMLAGKEWVNVAAKAPDRPTVSFVCVPAK